ncbi:RluA family pseudouridine synthase [Alishewanella longhuensis]
MWWSFALRRPQAERELKRQFAERLVKKRYLAVVAGFLSSDEGIITLPLRADPLNPPTQHVHPEGKAAETAYRVLQRSCKQGIEQTLVELKPVTGRSHQLRVHMSALGHPIVGDAFYAPQSIQQAAPRLLLHAAELNVFQPYSQQALIFVADTDFVSSNGHWPDN